MRKTRNCSFKAFFAASSAALALVAVNMPTAALAQACEESGGPSATLSPRIGQAIQELYAFMQEEQYQQALAGFNDLLASRGGNMSAFEQSTVYELRGSVNASLERFGAALQDFQRALDAGGLPETRNNQLRYFIAQLNVQEGNYAQAISGLRNWIQFAQRCGRPVDGNAYYLLAAALTQKSPPEWGAAVQPAEQAKASLSEPSKSYYDLLNLIYSETNNETKRQALLEEMVNIWPDQKAYWTQLSGSYSQAQKDQDAFSVLEVAYRAGLLETESELLTLIQYYSFFDNPYRGATMLEREMNAGNIARTQKNLVLLSQLWSQSREHKKSIPILNEAAGRAPNGELYYRLGQVLLADEQYSRAQTALQSALNRGGMDRDDTGDAWMLLGTARFSQAGPEDTALWISARQAFVNAQRYSGSAQQASQWISYIDAVVNTFVSGKQLEYDQNLEQCQAELDRIESNQRIRELQSTPATQAELDREQQTIDRCEALQAAGRPTRQSLLSGRSAASIAAEEAAEAAEDAEPETEEAADEDAAGEDAAEE